MNAQAKREFWRQHLNAIENPLVHFLPSSHLAVEVIREAAGELGFAFFPIDCQYIQSVSLLMEAFASTMNFPSYFGRSWDALVDMTRDFSWNKAQGYVLALSNADSLLPLPNGGFSTLLRVLEGTIREWRDERGEHGDRIGPTAFHVLFSGSDLLLATLSKQLKEPFCYHEADTITQTIRTPEGTAGSEIFSDAQKLLQSGADLELILLFLQDRGYGQVDSAYVVAGLTSKSVSEARAFVDSSQAWLPQLYEDDLKRRESARRALRDLGFS